MLLRNAPSNWSRFSHPEVAGDRRTGVYISLSGPHAGEMSLLTVDAQGNVLGSKPLPKDVRFKDLSLLDLTQREAGLPAEVTGAGFRKQQLRDLFYAEGIAAGDLNRDGLQDVVAGPFYYLGPD